jgi:site-specific DNA recombinase
MAPGKVQAAAIYCRISKDDAGRGAGVKRQEDDGRAYARGKGWLVAEVYVDNDASGWTGRPPHFDRMLADLAAGLRDAVVIYNVDRLTRQPFLFEEFLKVCEQQHVTRLGSVGGDIDLATSDGQFMARVLVAQAKKSSDDTSRRIRRAFDEKAANGQWKHGGLRPFGYDWDESAGTIVPVRAEAALIREAAKRVLAGDSRRAITVDWHRKGLLTSEGKPWSITRLANLLRSPRIAGLRVHRGEVVGKVTGHRSWT